MVPKPSPRQALTEFGGNEELRPLGELLLLLGPQVRTSAGKEAGKRPAQPLGASAVTVRIIRAVGATWGTATNFLTQCLFLRPRDKHPRISLVQGFVESSRLMLRSIWECKGPRRAEVTLKTRLED